MLCTDVKKLTSEYLDRRLAEQERQAFADHVALCPSCRGHLAETRDVARALRAAPRMAAPADLFESTMRAIDRTAAPRLTIATAPPRRRLRPRDTSFVGILMRLLTDYEFNIIAYSVGLVATCFLFGGTIMGLQPLWEIARDLRAEEPTIWITGSEAQVLGMRSEGGYRTVAYTLPRVDRQGSLPQFAASGEVPGSDDLMVLAEVLPDGRASIVQVLSAPDDPQVINRLQVALDRPAFVPASAISVNGTPVASRVVLLLQRVDVEG